eukprot:scaffold68609_cov17-Tisochrysis_lutea.AAC.1
MLPHCGFVATGTGKTMLARAVAGEANVPFFYTSGSEFEEVRGFMRWASSIAQLSDVAFTGGLLQGVPTRYIGPTAPGSLELLPCAGNRNPKDQQYMRMTLNQLLVELDGFKVKALPSWA